MDANKFINPASNPYGSFKGNYSQKKIAVIHSPKKKPKGNFDPNPTQNIHSLRHERRVSKRGNYSVDANFDRLHFNKGTNAQDFGSFVKQKSGQNIRVVKQNHINSKDEKPVVGNLIDAKRIEPEKSKSKNEIS